VPVVFGGHEHDDLVEWHGTAAPTPTRASSSSSSSSSSSRSSRSRDQADLAARFGPRARRRGVSAQPAGSTVVVKTGCNAEHAAVVDFHISLEPMPQVRTIGFLRLVGQEEPQCKS
jgi:hypothetical protein